MFAQSVFVRSAAMLAASAMTASWSPAPSKLQWTPVQPRLAPMITGVNTHFQTSAESAGYDPATSAFFLRKEGYTSFRDSVSTSRMTMMQERRLPQLKSLDRLNDFYGKSKFQYPSVLSISGWGQENGILDKQIEQYTSTITASLKLFPKVKIFEIWNEWDKGNNTDGTVKSYSALVQQAIPAIRRARPDAKILIGAAADDRGATAFPWTKALLSRPLVGAADGLSVHVYDHCNMRQRAQAGADIMGRLDDLRSAMVAVGKGALPIYVTETGWPTGVGGCLMNAETVASNIGQVMLLGASRPWVAGIWYYELKDSGDKGDNPESNFGILDYHNFEKPGACVARVVNKIISKAKFIGSYEGGDFTALKVNLSGKIKTIAWATNANRMVDLPTSVAYHPICKAEISGQSVKLDYRPSIFDGDLLQSLRR